MEEYDAVIQCEGGYIGLYVDAESPFGYDMGLVDYDAVMEEWDATPRVTYRSLYY